MRGGNLYQLKTAARPGQHVIIDGPMDKYGVVLKLQPSGFHLIRGLGSTKPEGVSLFHSTESSQ